MDTDPWLFDLDGCLVDSFSADTLRPLARDLLESLRAAGIPCHLWSAGGAEYAVRIAERVGIGGYFSSISAKERAADGYWALPPIGGVVTFVDDQVDGLDPHLATHRVAPYLSGVPHDRALEPLVDIVRSSGRGTAHRKQ